MHNAHASNTTRRTSASPTLSQQTNGQPNSIFYAQQLSSLQLSSLQLSSLQPLANPSVNIATVHDGGGTQSMRRVIASVNLTQSIEQTQDQVNERRAPNGQPNLLIGPPHSLSGDIPAVIYLHWLKHMYAWAQNPANQKDGDLNQLKTALQRLEFTANHQTTSCDLSDLGITSLDDATFNSLGQLQALNLSYNQLNVLPSSINQLSHLQQLYLADNQLSELPENFDQLNQLKILSLSWNQFRALPNSICQLNQLQTLYLNNNQLRSLPTNFGRLAKLQTLKLEWNQLPTLPAGFGRLSELQTLCLDFNQLRTLPTDLGRLSKLQTLELEWNQFRALSTSFDQLSALQHLNLRFNPLSTFDRIRLLQTKRQLGLQLKITQFSHVNLQQFVRRKALYDFIGRGVFDAIESPYVLSSSLSCQLTGKPSEQIIRPVVFSDRLYELAALMDYWLKNGASPENPNQPLLLESFFSGEQRLKKICFEVFVE